MEITNYNEDLKRVKQLLKEKYNVRVTVNNSKDIVVEKQKTNNKPKLTISRTLRSTYPGFVSMYAKLT